MFGIKILAKLLIFTGLTFVLIGSILYISPKIPGLGKLPGDIIIQKKNFSFYFPLTTCIIVSFVLSLVAWLFFRR